MGRRKIEIKPIRDDRNRSVTFLKRKGGLFKKAHELSVLCSVDVAVIIFGHNKKLYEFSSSDINEIVGRFQYYGGAHEHKGPSDFADKRGGDEEDEDEEPGEEGGEERGTPAPPQQAPSDHPMMHPQMQNHPGFQHVRSSTPAGSPPMPNGAMPQFQRGPSPLPPGMSRPSSRTSQHPQQHTRHPSLNAPPQAGQPPPPTYAYQPNPPLYHPQPGQMQQRPPPQPSHHPHQATYPPPYPPPPHILQGNPQMQQAYLQDNRRSTMPPAFPPQPPPQGHPGQDQLRPPPPQSRTPQPGQMRAGPSPQPPQQQFSSPPMPQPRPLPAHAKAHSIFTPIDDSRSMLAQNWGSTGNIEGLHPDAAIKAEPRSQSIDVAAMQRGNNSRMNGPSPKPLPGRALPRSPQPPQRTASSPAIPPPTRTNTGQSDAKRPRLKVQIPSEQSGDEGDSADPSALQTGTAATGVGLQQTAHHGVVLPPPSPSGAGGALLSAGAQGPPNPFARPAPPMTTNPHAANRDVASNHIETPLSALPSRFMNDNLLPSPSTFYPEWGFGRSGDSNLLPSPLNFQTPIVGNGAGWREEVGERKRGGEEQEAGDSKRAKQ